MQKLYKSCYEMDNRCYESYALTEDILMEHAANGMAEYIRAKFAKGCSVLIVSGMGNNGADGIALARLLHGDYAVKLYLPFGVRSVMAEVQLERVQCLDVELVDEVEAADVIVDAIFGAGLSRELNEETRKLIVKLESLEGFKIACDVPTGIDVDGNPLPMAFFADVTLTMGAMKEALFSDMAKDYVGEVIGVDLGLHHDKYTQGFITHTFLLDEEDMKLPSRNWSKTTHKGSFGHLAVIAGAKEGAGLLTASAGLRFGAGLVTMVGELTTPLPLSIMQDIQLPYNTTAICFGMGFGSDFEQEIVEEIIDHEAPIVLDADIFHSGMIMEFLEHKDRDIVLTPHPKEFVSLWQTAMETPLNVAILQANRLKKVREFCEAYPHVTLLLKGANMIIAKEEELYINPYGSSKLSKGGSGDVLSGLIGALLAQGESPLDATISASLALTVAAQAYDGASYAMLPTDIIEEIGRLEKNSRTV